MVVTVFHGLWVVPPHDASILNLRNLEWRRLGSPLDVLMIESIFLILWVIVILRVVW